MRYSGPGFGADTIASFGFSGNQHDTISLASSQFATIAAVLSHTTDGVNGAVINAGNGDRITVQGVTKADLQANKKDFVLHA